MKNKFLNSTKKCLNYYTAATRTWQLKNKVIIKNAFFHSFNINEKKCLERASEIFGNQADFTDGYKQKTSFVVALKKVSFLGNTGAVVDNTSIIIESVLDLTRLAFSSSFKTIKLLKPVNKKGVFTSIIHLNYSNNFYHWNIDCLPRLFNIKQIPSTEDINLIIHKDQPNYQKEVLSLFLKQDPRLKPVYISKKEKWHIEKYWLPSFLTNNQSGFMPKENIEYVKDTVISGFNIEPATNKRKIYISRSQTKRRKLLNESEIEEFLSQKGVEIIYAEKLSFKDQVRIFSEAELIISPHGAGLSNIIYSSDAMIIEIHPANFVQTHYCMLSSACNHNYNCFIANNLDSNKNFTIEINEFKNYMENEIFIL